LLEFYLSCKVPSLYSEHKNHTKRRRKKIFVASKRRKLDFFFKKLVAPLFREKTSVYPQSKPLSVMTFFINAPICAGDLVTATPALSNALILSVAVPFPPEIIAPACPILLPGGAVNPAIKLTTGFFVPLFLINSAASSSALPPISPIIIIPSV
jgi:hypothetical protein